MSPDEAERWVLDLELFGMRFGLERMRELLAALGEPQRAFDAVHVVGTNGKSSTVRVLAALLRAEGLRAGAYLSPHLVSLGERVRVDDRDATPEAFAAAATRVRAVAGPEVTQFEALTAIAFVLLAEAGVEVAAVEAGLGGRFDATNVLDASRVQVLTNVGLEHTRWLGPTVADVAAEKVAVLRPGATLVVGHGLHPQARAVVEREVAAKGARLVEAPAVEGPFRARNLATAAAAAEAFLGRAPAPLPFEVPTPGRFEVLDGEVQTILDGAHNAEGMAALAEALGGRRVVACVSVLDDKDARGMLAALLPSCEAVVCCTCSHPRAVPAEELAALVREVPVEVVPEPRAALARARELAGRAGAAALAAGSLYLLADLRRPPGARRSTL